MKKIDCCSSSFRKLIKSESLYVDKTDYAFKLLELPGGYFFLSRPRRFGKSLTLSTFESIFEGEKELFKGLKIYKKDYSWQKYPILRFDWSQITYKNSRDCEKQIKAQLFMTCKKYNINSIDPKFSYNCYLSCLIDELINSWKAVSL